MILHRPSSASHVWSAEYTKRLARCLGSGAEVSRSGVNYRTTKYSGKSGKPDFRVTRFGCRLKFKRSFKLRLMRRAWPGARSTCNSLRNSGATLTLSIEFYRRARCDRRTRLRRSIIISFHLRWSIGVQLSSSDHPPPPPLAAARFLSMR